jgi:hypothetical protein
MPPKLTYYLSLAGLVGLIISFPWWLNANTENLGLAWAIGSGTVAPLLLLFACVKRTRNWSGITALCMIPFAVIGVMEIVATLGTPDSGMAVGIISILTFFTVLDAGRRHLD